MYEKILIATDGSDHMNRGANVAIGFYKIWKSEITLFHSIKHMLGKVSSSDIGVNIASSLYPSLNLSSPSAPMINTSPASGPMLSDKNRGQKTTALTVQEVERIGLRILQEKKMIFDEVNVPVKTKLVVREDPEDYIVRIVPKKKYNLVLVGSTGLHSKLRKIFLGSVTKHIVDDAPCDVLVIK